MADHDQADLTTLTVELLSAYFANNLVPSDNLSELIQSTYSALAGIDAPAPVEAEEPTFTPAVSVKKSLASPDHIISMIDGKPYKTLKRHLRANGLSPAEYRERYKLPATYPIVAPAFSEARRAVAAKHGLGGSKKRGGTVAPSAVTATQSAGVADDAAAEASVAASKPAGSQTVASPPKVARKASKAARQSNVDAQSAAAADQDVGQSATPPSSSVSDTPIKQRRKLKIKVAAPAEAESMPAKTAKAQSAPQPLKAKAVSTDQGKADDAPKPAKRAYKKRASKSMQA